MFSGLVRLHLLPGASILDVTNVVVRLQAVVIALLAEVAP